MTLLEAVKTVKGCPGNVAGRSRKELPELFVQLGYKVGAEVGVYKGEFNELLCKSGLQIYGIDPWKAYDDYDNKSRHSGPTQERQDFLYSHAKRTLDKYPNCSLVRKTSMEAVKDFKDEELDFVYIDGHHGLKYVIEDIWEWSKKVRKGGIVSGHDYLYSRIRSPYDPYVCHVRIAVDAYVKAAYIENFLVFGQKKDIWASWLWIKQ